MTVSAPPRDAFMDDPLERAVLSGDREAGIGALMGAVQTPAGRGDIESVLKRRLGGDMSRRKKQQALKPVLPEGQPLFRNLMAALVLEETSDAAVEMVRILESAVERGTSDDLMSRAMAVVLKTVTDPTDRNVTPPEAGSPAPSRPAPAPVRTGTATAPAPAARTRPRPPRYDLEGPFRIPDGVVRFGELEEMLAAPLLPPSKTAGGAGPVRVPSALTAPPETNDPDLIRGWLRGVPAFSDSVGIRAGLLDMGDPGDLMEIEAEFHTDPKTALRLYRAASPVADGTADTAWCARLGRDIGRFGVTHERGVEILARMLGEQIRRGPPERLAPLARSGAVMVVREELAEAVCGLLDAEAEFIADGPQDPTGPDQNLLGAFSPSCDLSRGRCLERALSLHLVAGLPMGGAMRQSLTEFRIAQALRENPEAPIGFLDQRFDLDAALPLAELCGREPIVRIGLTMPALA